MKSDALPHWTSDIVPYNSSTLQVLQKSLNASSAGDICIFGGISKGGKWGWLARNSNLEIIDPRTGNRTSGFCFGHSTGNSKVNITCVKEYEYRGSSKLAVGLQMGNGEGMLCVYDPRVSKIVIAVDIPHVVTAVEPITSCGGTNAPNFALNEHLRCFFGIIAVGTKSGHIFLVDLCLDEDDYSDEMTARQIKVVTPRTQDVESSREKLIAKGDHLAQEINSNCHTFRSFNYDSPSGKTLKSLYPSEVSVTAMKYISQIGSLAVGFNFGGFQLWKLAVPMIEYCSPLTQQTFPVTHFAYQEPEDDPQYFCYIWVGRGPLATDSSQDVPTSLHLFQLSYDAKEVYPRHGHIYRDLTGCVPRFQYDLTGETGQKSEGCRLITCTALAKDVAPGARHEDSTMEEEDNRQDLSLASFAWEAPSDPAGGQSGSSCFVGLFDLNRWYHAQMPLAVSTRDSEHSCSYLAVCSLETVMEAAAPDVLLDLHIDAAHISRYLSTITPAPEQHFHPSALSFDITNLMETGVVFATFLGAQHQVLGDMTQLGPSVLREPQSFYNRCWASGLLVKSRVLDKGLANLTPQTQRETLLSIALDHNLIGFLMDCINSFAMGDFESGCTLRTVLDWAWNKVASIKQSVDHLCVPLYDGFGSTVDEQTMKQLDQHAVQMGHMITIFQSLLDQSATTTEQGLRDLEMKYGVVTLICQHLQVMLWFVKTGLLPECSDDMGDPLEGQFCYPAKRLREVYAQRRTQLQKLCKNNGNGDILMIDGLVSQVGASLVNLWDGKDNQGGSGIYPSLKENQGASGLYPPPSFHAMLDMYLLENVPIVTKHSIVGYFLLDIIFTLSDVKYEEMARKIELFYQCFSLPLGMIKMLQGFWYLDHKDFDQAIEILLDPAVRTYLDASPWQHRNVIRAFLYYNESKRANQYIRTVRPALLNPEDVELHLTVLLANKLTGEAFEFQRQHRDVTTSSDLLHQLFLGSQQTKTMDELLKLPFDEDEDAALVRYLQDSTEPNSQELLVMHYLQRGRYVEAIRANERLKQHSLMDIGSDALARERTCARNVIVETYSKLLPGIQRKLAFGPETGVDRTKMIRREVVKPKPLSSIINPAKTSKVMSHGLLVNAVLDRIAEAHVKLRQDETPTKTWAVGEHVEESPPMEPFIGTPVITRNRTSRLSTSVVYPKVQELVLDNTGIYQASPMRTVSFMAAQTSVNMPTPDCLTENYKRPPIDYSGATALSLLQTPTISKRRTLVDKPKTIDTNMPPTPQSILKVRKVARRSPGPSPVVQTAVPKHKVKGVSMADMIMPTPPFFHRKQLSFAADVSMKDEKKKTSTPVKRISFADETFGKSPSPEPKTTIHYTAVQHASPGTPSPVKTTASSSLPTSSSPSSFQKSPSPFQKSPSPTKESPSQFKAPVSMPSMSSSPPKDTHDAPMDMSPTKELSPPRGILSPPKGTSPPQEPSPASSIPSEPIGIPASMDTSLSRDTPTPPFLSPASSPPRFSDSPPKQVSFAPIPVISQGAFSPIPVSSQVPSIEEAASPKQPEVRSDSPTDDMFEQAVGDQMVVDDEITFNITTREDEEELKEEEAPAEDQMETEQETQSEPTRAPSTNNTDATTPEDTADDDEREVSLIPSPRPPIHPIPEPSSPVSWQHHSSHSTPPRAEQNVLQSFPTPPSTSHEPQSASQEFPSYKPPSSDMSSSPMSADMPPPHQRLSMPSTFSPTTSRSFGVSPFIGTGAFSTQEGVQTSPMAPSLLFGRPGLITTEMSAQTTPGLALRENDSPSSRPRTSFAASLQSSRSNVTAPPSGNKEMGETRDANAQRPVDRHPQLAIKQEPLSPPALSPPPEPLSPPDHIGTQLQQEPFSSVRVKHEPLSLPEERTRNEQDSPDGTNAAPSFIFSPPTTRSRARRSAHKSLSVMTTPAVHTDKPSFLMPTPGPTPSERFGKTSRSSTPKTKRSTSRIESLDKKKPSATVGKTPTSVAKSDTLSSVRHSPRSRRKTPSIGNPDESFASPGVPSPATPASVSVVTRLRTRKSMKGPSDVADDVILLSPGSAASSKTTKPKKVVRLKHTMTLRTTPKKPTRNVKLW